MIKGLSKTAYRFGLRVICPAVLGLIVLEHLTKKRVKRRSQTAP
jgi:hypothetical protein